jgi:hypothetical protein
MNVKTASLLFGAAFIAVGILGFFSNPIVGENPDAIFHTDTLHNVIHLVSGALFILIPMAKTGVTSSFMKLFGLIYLLLGLLGLFNVGMSEDGKLLGFLHINEADNYLHIGLGVLIFMASFLRPDTTVRVNGNN